MYLPNGWRTSTIGELCEFINGNGFKPSEWSNEGLPIIRIQNLNGSNDFNYYSGEPLKKWLVNPGQLLFAWAGTKGVSFGPKIWNGPQGVLNQHIFKLNPISDVNTFWFYSVLVRTTEQIESYAHGFKSTLLHVQKSDITDQSILVPPIPEQQKIAQILSTWDKAIEKLEALIAAKQKRKKALMQQLLTGKMRFQEFDGEWGYFHLKDIVHIFVSPVDKKTTANEQPVLLCNYTDVYYNIRITKLLAFMRATATEQEISKFSLKKGDVVITKDSETPGDIAIPAFVSEDLGGVVCGYHLAILRPKKGKIDGEYLSYLFSLKKTRYYFYTLATGATRFGLSIGAIEKANFYLPPIEEQQKIANVLSSADKEITTHQNQLAALKQQKTGLMQQLLTGKKRVHVGEIAIG